jgi:hypothetical protein
MAALEQVDRVKAELQAARQALREADNWTILATDIEEVRIVKIDLIIFISFVCRAFLSISM